MSEWHARESNQLTSQFVNRIIEIIIGGQQIIVNDIICGIEAWNNLEHNELCLPPATHKEPVLRRLGAGRIFKHACIFYGFHDCPKCIT